MPTPDFDWSFDLIPAEQESGATPPVLAPAVDSPPARKRRARRWPRWLLAAGLALAAGTALGGYVFQRVGWQRLVAQITHEVVSEDRFARAGDLTMVRSFLADDDEAWAALRAAEARQGLAVTLPAGHMRPVDEPPRVDTVEVLDDQIFEARVLRAFTDPSGQVYDFAYLQRYRNLGPGLWERLPTDTADITLQGRWTGERLAVTAPLADWPWLRPALPRLDAWLVQACADWDCPSHAQVSLTFTAQPADLRPVRGVSTALEPGPATLPVVFGLGRHRPLFPSRLVLPALQAAGTPVDAQAGEALLRAIAAQTLLHLAQQVAGLTQQSADYYLEALVARAEVRLGLSPALRFETPPEAFVPPPGLWSRGLGGRAVDLPPELTYRLQALAFLNYALEGQPAATDGALLRSLRQQPGLMPWLTAALGPAAAVDLPGGWTARVTAAATPGQPLGWPRLDGLTYTCEDGAWLIRGQGLEPLWTDTGEPQATASRLSPDGRFVATLRFSSVDGQGNLRVLEVDTGQAQPAAEAPFIALLGWSADNRLLYLQNDVAEAGQRGVRLMRYDPAAAASRMVVANAVRPYGVDTNDANEANWSPDRTALVLTLNVAQAGETVRWEAALVRVADGSGVSGQVQPLATASAVPILAPRAGEAVFERLTPWPELVLQELSSGEQRQLVRAGDLLQPVTNGPDVPERLLPIEWSPDGEELLFMATGALYGNHLYRVGRDGQDLRHLAGAGPGGWVTPLGYSADGRYLGYFEASPSEVRLQLLDTATGGAQDLPVFPGSVAWSTDGHLLAVAGEEGAYVLDLATGERRWLAFQTCQRVSW